MVAEALMCRRPAHRLFWFPAFSRLFYEVVFEEECPADIVDMLVGSGNDVISALKCTKKRDMAMRGRLTSHIRGLIERGQCTHLGLDESIPVEEWALFIQVCALHPIVPLRRVLAVQMRADEGSSGTLSSD